MQLEHQMLFRERLDIAEQANPKGRLHLSYARN